MADPTRSPRVVVLDRDADVFARDLATALPGVPIVTGTSEAEVLPHCATATVLVGLAHLITPAMVAAARDLTHIQALTTGVDALRLLDLPAGITITSARGIHGPQMSEIAFLYMLSLSRDFPRILDNQKTGTWERWPQTLLLGKTAVLVGIGAISEELARRCKAFGMRVVGVSSARTEAEGFDLVLPRSRLLEAAGMADFLIALVPYAPETHHMIDGPVFDALPPHAKFINIARGNVVDEAAMVARLVSGTLAGAGLDVFSAEPLPPDHPLWTRDTVIITPHIGGMSDVYAEQVMPLVIHNLRAIADGRPGDLRNVVTLPPKADIP